VIAHIEWRGKQLTVDLASGRSLAIMLDPHGSQPSFFASQPASAKALHHDDYIGSVRQGGSCNAEVIQFAPHCHGTHTEGSGHISEQQLPVQEIIYPTPTLARLITLTDTALADCEEHVPGQAPSSTPLLTLAQIINRLDHQSLAHVEALLVRTLPNPEDKTRRDYAAEPVYPVFSSEALTWLSSQPLKHLLVDTPSLDPAHDQGRLTNHRQWWGGNARLEEDGLDPRRRSVTEMIYVPDDIQDGAYWLHLELSPILSDACSSRPVIYPMADL